MESYVWRTVDTPANGTITFAMQNGSTPEDVLRTLEQLAATWVGRNAAAGRTQPPPDAAAATTAYTTAAACFGLHPDDVPNFLAAAAQLYHPLVVHVSLVDGVPASQGDIGEDCWTPLYLATVVDSESFMLNMLQFHAAFGLKLIRHLAFITAREKIPHRSEHLANVPSLATVGDFSRALLIDDLCCTDDDDEEEMPLLSPSLSRVTKALTPFLRALVAVQQATTTTSSTSSAAHDATARTIRRVVTAFMSSLHEGKLEPSSSPGAEAPSTSSLGASTSSVPAAVGEATIVRRPSAVSLVIPAHLSNAAEPQMERSMTSLNNLSSTSMITVGTSRHRPQLFVDVGELFEVCRQGSVRLMAKLIQKLPLGAIFPVSFDYDAIASAADQLRRKHLAGNTSDPLSAADDAACVPPIEEFATFKVSFQEAVKLCFFHECFIELPSPVSSLRATATMQRSTLASAKSIYGSMARLTNGSSLCVGPRGDTLSSFGAGSVSLLHFRFLRRLLSKTHDVHFFREYFAVLKKEVSGAAELPIALPAAFAVTAEFAQRPEIVMAPVVLDKLMWLVCNGSGDTSDMAAYLLAPPATDAARFTELWMAESCLHDAKKFKTRAEMLAFAILLFSSSAASAIHDEETPSPQSVSQYLRQASLGAMPMTSFGSSSATNSAAPTTAQTAAQHQRAWVQLWSTFFGNVAASAGSVVANLEMQMTADDVSDAHAHAHELVRSLKAVLASLAECTSSSDTGNNTSANSESGGPNPPVGSPLLSLQDKFESAERAFAKVAAKQPTDVKLRFYGLYKQATVGDVNISRPWAMDVAGRAKYDAWASWQGKTAEEAMQAYVDQWALLSSSAKAQ